MHKLPPFDRYEPNDIVIGIVVESDPAPQVLYTAQARAEGRAVFVKEGSRCARASRGAGLRAEPAGARMRPVQAAATSAVPLTGRGVDKDEHKFACRVGGVQVACLGAHVVDGVFGGACCSAVLQGSADAQQALILHAKQCAPFTIARGCRHHPNWPAGAEKENEVGLPLRNPSPDCPMRLTVASPSGLYVGEYAAAVR